MGELGNPGAEPRKLADGGATQPYAEIYRGPSGDTRLRVFPQVEVGAVDDRVGAFGSCIKLR